MEKNMINALDGVPLLLIHQSVHPSKIGSIPHDTPSLDTSFALQGSWMLIEQAHRRFGQTESTMVIERFRLEQLTRLKVTSQSLQYILILYVHNSRFWDFLGLVKVQGEFAVYRFFWVCCLSQSISINNPCRDICRSCRGAAAGYFIKSEYWVFVAIHISPSTRSHVLRFVPDYCKAW